MACCAAIAVSARVWEWMRAWVILQRVPVPPGKGMMGHLQYFNDSIVGHHKTVARWAREYGPIYRVRLANVHVSVSASALPAARAHQRGPATHESWISSLR